MPNSIVFNRLLMPAEINPSLSRGNKLIFIGLAAVLQQVLVVADVPKAPLELTERRADSKS